MLSLFQIQVSEAKYTGVTQTLVKIGKDEGLYGYFKVWKLRITYDSLVEELGYWLNPNPDPYVVQTVEMLGLSLVLYTNDLLR